MNLQLYMHPLSSFCHKVLIALYENGTPFEPRLVKLDEEASREAFRKVWPILRFPVLRDELRGRTVPESSIIIEYLELHYPGRTALLPLGPQAALMTVSRFFGECVARGLIEAGTDVEQLADYFLGALRGSLFNRALLNPTRAPTDKEVERHIDFVIDTFLRGCRAPAGG